jgi:hypothetical protein
MGRPLVIACGALVSELRAALEAGGIADAVEVRYLPANLHNRPEAIEPSVRTLLDELDPGSTRTVLLGYADCGSGGALDRLIAERPNVHRMPGAHCYEFFAGSRLFAELHDAEPGTFYLTDFLAKHFDALVWQGLGLDRHPELRDMYFGNYTRVLLLTQATAHTDVVDAGQRAAEQLGLRFEHLHVGLDKFSIALGKVA